MGPQGHLSHGAEGAKALEEVEEHDLEVHQDTATPPLNLLMKALLLAWLQRRTTCSVTICLVEICSKDDSCILLGQ